MLPLDLCPQRPIAFSGKPLHALGRIESCPLKRELVVLQFGVTRVNGGNLARLKSVLVQKGLGALLVVQERNNLIIDPGVQIPRRK